MKLLRAEQPDIVCLQEVVKIDGGEAFVTTDIGTLQKETGYKHCFFVPSFTFKLMRREAQFGLAILSNVPFIDTKNIYTGLNHHSDFDVLHDDYNIRHLQHVTVHHNNELLHILNHHGHHVPEHKHGNDETIRQCTMIANYIKSLSGSVVLCGDFNLHPDSESLRVFDPLLKNHAKEQGIETTRTMLTSKTEVCDYIFTSPTISIRSFTVLEAIASDHKALTIEM